MTEVEERGIDNPVFDTDGVSVKEDVIAEDQRGPKTETEKHELLYKLNDKPRWHLSILLGIQHCLLASGGMIGMPMFLSPFLCIPDNDDGYVGRAMLLSSLFFVSGLVTFLQTTFGTRLPIMQGSSFSFIPPALAILSLPHHKCPLGPVDSNLTNGSVLYNDTDGSLVDTKELWNRRIREVQGAIAVASVTEFLLAVTGAIGFLMRFIGPITVAPSIALIGLALFEAAARNASGQWGIAMFTAGILIISSQYLRNVGVPLPTYSGSQGCHITRIYVFKLLPVFITLVLSFVLCTILTATGVFPDDPKQPGYTARTDVRINVLQNSPWFIFPYPFQWGTIVVSGAGVVGMIAGVFSGIVESIGDYYACAKISGGPPLPKHALNRGLAMEGLGCILAGLIGTGTGMTSYSDNIAAIGITRVGSRRVLQVAGLVFLILGMFGKIGAVLVLIPNPVIGGMFCTVFGMIIAVGLSNLQYVDLNSPRNLFVVGFSLFMGITVSVWMRNNPRAINTGVAELDQIITVLLSTSMFIGGFLASFLDNTLPGSLEERGMLSWNKDNSSEELTQVDREEYDKWMARCYNLPFNTNFRFSKYIPILPEYGQKNNPKEEVEMH